MDSELKPLAKYLFTILETIMDFKARSKHNDHLVRPPA